VSVFAQTFPSALAAAISESDTLFAGASEVFFTATSSRVGQNRPMRVK